MLDFLIRDGLCHSSGVCVHTFRYDLSQSVKWNHQSGRIPTLDGECKQSSYFHSHHYYLCCRSVDMSNRRSRSVNCRWYHVSKCGSQHVCPLFCHWRSSGRIWIDLLIHRHLRDANARRQSNAKGRYGRIGKILQQITDAMHVASRYDDKDDEGIQRQDVE